MAVLEYDEGVGLEQLLESARKSHQLQSHNLEQKFGDKRLHGVLASTACWSEPLLALPPLPPGCERTHNAPHRRGWVAMSNDGKLLLRVMTLSDGHFRFTFVVSPQQTLEVLFDVIKTQLG